MPTPHEGLAVTPVVRIESPPVTGQAYCVLGMHRSGTSLVASLLSRAGVHMGERLLHARPDNPRGYFEDADIVAFHERCLARRGVTYINPGDAALTFTDAERDEASRLIRDRAARSAWGWKDPRTCLFVRSWRELLPECRFVVVHRSPLAVAASLARRGELTTGADAASALRAWARYAREVAAFLEEAAPRSVVFDAEAIFDDPEGVCAALRGLGVAMSAEDVRAVAAGSEFRRATAEREMRPLLDAVDPAIHDLRSALIEMSDVSAREEGDSRREDLTHLALAAQACKDSPAALSAIVEAALCTMDPGVGDAIAQSRRNAMLASERVAGVEQLAYAAAMDLQRDSALGRDSQTRGVIESWLVDVLHARVEMEREASRMNYESAQAAEAASRRNYEHALAAEAASTSNFLRAQAAEARLTSAEESAAENYRRAMSAEAAAKANYDRALSAEDASLKNYERVVRLEAMMESVQSEIKWASERIKELEAVAKANHEHAMSAEDASKSNYERAESAEQASRMNYERALAAEEASRKNYERAQAAEANLERLSAEIQAARAESTVAAQSGPLVEQLQARLAEIGSNLASAQDQSRRLDVRCASLMLQLEDAMARLASERESAATIARFAESSRTEAGRLRATLARMEGERNYYRRRWPPYAAKRIIQKTAAKFHAKKAARTREIARFGERAQTVVMLTGLPAAEHGERVFAALAAQTRAPTRVIVPGDVPELDAIRARIPVSVKNWWSPDVTALTRGHDFVLLVHPQHYGQGPLYSPLCVEMAAAALADDPQAHAVIFRGAPGPPGIQTHNHVYETDAATIKQWPNETLAAMVRAERLPEAFGIANEGESRSIGETLAALARGGGRVLVAPRTFPLDPAEALAASRSVGAKLPATPRSAIRGLFITQWLECGGADKGVIDLLTRVSPDVVEFSLLTTLASAHPWEHRVCEHVREICHLGDHLSLPAEGRFDRFIVEYARRRNIELIHIMHSFLGYDSLPALKASLPGITVVDQCHILEPPDVMEGGHPAYSSRRYGPLIDHRTVTSEWLKAYLVREHGVPERNVSVIHTGVDWQEEFNPDHHARGEMRTALRIPDEASLVIFVGRLYWQKRPWLFVRIAEEVMRRRPDLDVHFAMFGPGPERDRIEGMRLALPDPDRLHIVGEVPHAGPVYKDADLMLMPSGHEGLAYVSYEAMAMGVPQIFTDVNGQSELITPDTGVLLPVDEEATVSHGVAAVIDLLDHPEKRQAMARAGRERIRANFGLDKVVEKYESLYRRLRQTSR